MGNRSDIATMRAQGEARERGRRLEAARVAREERAAAPRPLASVEDIDTGLRHAASVPADGLGIRVTALCGLVMHQRGLSRPILNLTASRTICPGCRAAGKRGEG